MKINVTAESLEIQGLSTSELRVISSALSCFISEAGTPARYASEVAERLAEQIPQVIFNIPRYFCKVCRTNFYEDEIRVELVGSREERVETCPCCGTHLIEKV